MIAAKWAVLDERISLYICFYCGDWIPFLYFFYVGSIILCKNVCLINVYVTVILSYKSIMFQFCLLNLLQYINLLKVCCLLNRLRYIKLYKMHNKMTTRPWCQHSPIIIDTETNLLKISKRLNQHTLIWGSSLWNWDLSRLSTTPTWALLQQHKLEHCFNNTKLSISIIRTWEFLQQHELGHFFNNTI